MSEIKKVAVIGAGVMGAGIAAQAANGGAQVLLLDIVPEGASDRDAVARGALEKLQKSKPAALMHKRRAALITPGNIEDDLHKLADCDWVIEAVVERLDVKRTLYRRIAQHRGPATVVSSNTSTLPLAELCEGLPADFRRHFLITHFFNPPRYMPLLEIVASADTDSDVVARVRHFADHVLGKSVVDCKDRPGFIANRLGTFWLHSAVIRAITQGVGVEEADAVLSRPVGVPKTGVFGLLDLVGLDLMPHILRNLAERLPADDPFQRLGPPPSLLRRMIEEGRTGRKGKGGFYRLNEQGEKEALALHNDTYGPARRPKPAAVAAGRKGGLRAVLEHPSAEGRYAWSVLSETLAYATQLVPEVADDIEAVDRAMRLGYNWKRGPFELIDKLGAAWFAEKLEADGRPVPPLLAHAAREGSFYRGGKGSLEQLGADGAWHPVRRADGVLLLEDQKRGAQPLLRNRSASVWDIGEGVACLEFHSKANSLNPLIINLLRKALRELPARGYKGLVIYNEGQNFSVGANIAMLLVGGKMRMWRFIRWVLKDGQQTFNAMKHGPFPVVGAPSGMALGGGCEILLHCHAVTAHAETYMGLVEAGVGIVPGWGGCKEMLSRWFKAPKTPKGPVAPVIKAFEVIAQAQVSTSAEEARDLQFLRADDNIVMNRERLLATARERVLALAADFTPPPEETFHLPGASGRAALALGVRDFVKKGLATPHDAVIAAELARVLCGGDTDTLDELTEADILRLERDAIVKLMHTPQSRARVEHMLRKGKPLRN